MAGPYDKANATATRLISKYGRSLILRRYTDAVPDPDKPWVVGTPSYNDYPVRSVRTETENSAPDCHTETIAGDEFRKHGIEPQMTDILIEGTSFFAIIKPPNAARPDGNAIVWKLEAKLWPGRTLPL